MYRVELNEVLENKYSVISFSKNSQIISLKNSKILKLFNSNYLLTLKSHFNINMEQKLIDSFKYKISSSVKKPIALVYHKNIFVGYIMDKAYGQDLETYFYNMSLKDRVNLHKYAMIHGNIEKVVRESNDIVFTDLCTYSNIFIDKDYNINIIDYDSYQTGKHEYLSFSTGIGEEYDYQRNTKYYKDNLFTKELDIKSLITLYFMDVFNVDLTMIGDIDYTTGRIITLDDIFKYINLTDDDFKDKVFKIFDNKQNNLYFGDDLLNLAENYKLTILNPNERDANKLIKRLVR